MATCAALSVADEALRATVKNSNFQRLCRLLMRGGITLLMEVFDSINPPANLPLTLRNPTIKAQLQRLRKNRVFSQPEWDCLYLPAGMYGKSADFDISLLFKLLRNICTSSLTPPATGWDNLPNNTDHSLEADLVRIKYYRNSFYGHNHSMEIIDADFAKLWTEISEVLLRIANSISSAKRVEWKESINKLQHDPLTPDAQQYVAELQTWYKKDMDTKDEIEKLRIEVQQVHLNQQEQLEMMNMMLQQVITKQEVLINIQTTVASNGGSSISSSHGTNETQLQAEAHLQPESAYVCMPSEQPQPQAYATAGSSTSWAELQTNQQNFQRDLDIWHIILSFKSSFALLIEYLRIKLGVDVRTSSLGSLVITVSCSSLPVLEGLWEDYCSGHLDEVIQETLVTEEVLKELNLSKVKLKTIISEEEYNACKELLTQRSENVKLQQPFVEKTRTRETTSTASTTAEVNKTNSEGIGSFRSFLSKTKAQQSSAEGKGIIEATVGLEAEIVVTTKTADGVQCYEERDHVTVEIRNRQGHDIKTLLDNLHEEVSCSVCMCKYTDPKQLPCLHSFCLHCLNGIQRTSASRDTIACPECRQEFSVPGNGNLSALPTNFRINSLLDVLAIQECNRQEHDCVTEAQIQDNKDGTYKISYFAKETRTCQASVKVNGEHIRRSPFEVQVKTRQFKPILSFGQEGSSVGNLKWPWGVAVNKQNEIVVSDRMNNRIQVFSSNGTCLRSFGRKGDQQGQFGQPTGIAVSNNNNIVVVDRDNHRVQILSEQGEFLSQFGEEGILDHQLMFPLGLSIDSNGNFIVADPRNNLIKIFSPDGQFLRKIGRDGCLFFPCHCIQHEKYLIVSDSGDHSIKVFDREGNFIYKFGNMGQEDREFNYSGCLSVNKAGQLMVCDSDNHRVQVFELSGKFITKFGTFGSKIGQFNIPVSIAVLSDGKIVVSDCDNNRIQMFE